MESWRERFDPVGWKVYTLGKLVDGDWVSTWRLDDDDGHRFLDEAERLGVPLVCAHKGIALLAAAGSPEDVGPAARAHPNVNFVIYHSGYELPGRRRRGRRALHRGDRAHRREPADLHAARARPRPRRQRLRRARHHLVLSRATARRRGARARQAAWRNWARTTSSGAATRSGTGRTGRSSTRSARSRSPSACAPSSATPSSRRRSRRRSSGSTPTRLYGIDAAAARGRRGRDDLGWISAARAPSSSAPACRSAT